MKQVVIENPVINTLFDRNVISISRGEHKKDKVSKVSTAKTLWLPAINNHGGFGRWAFIEITDPWNAKNEIRESLRETEAGPK